MYHHHALAVVADTGHEIPMADNPCACPSRGEGLTNDVLREHQVTMPPNAANRDAVVLKLKNRPLCGQDALACLPLRLARTAARFVRP